MAAKKTKAKETNAEPRAIVQVGQTGCMPATIEELWRHGKMISQSTMIPERYRGNEGDCTIAIEVSMRLGCSWLAVMQHMYVVHGIPAMDAALATALTNTSGLFVDPIEFEVEGTDPKGKDYRVRGYATRESTGKTLYGPWIDWPLVRGERWDAKDGSKWKTMPDQMFHYRAASWFQRRFCPEVTMGMLTPDEIEDMPERKRVESRTVARGVEGVKERLKKNAEAASKPAVDPEPPVEQSADEDYPLSEEGERDEATEAKVQEQKDRIIEAELEDEGQADEGAEAVGATGEGSNLF